VNVLLDECSPRPLRGFLKNIELHTVEMAGFKGLKNGDLIRAADGRYDVLITADKNLRYQQNLSGRKIAIIELPFNSWKRLKNIVPKIQSALAIVQPGQYLEITRD
jgi:hypothetical protein